MQLAQQMGAGIIFDLKQGRAQTAWSKTWRGLRAPYLLSARRAVTWLAVLLF